MRGLHLAMDKLGLREVRQVLDGIQGCYDACTLGAELECEIITAELVKAKTLLGDLSQRMKIYSKQKDKGNAVGQRTSQPGGSDKRDGIDSAGRNV